MQFQVDIIADNYRKSVNSIKKCERTLRGESDPIQIASLQSRVPGDFRQKVLRNAENKARLVELIYKLIECNYNELIERLKKEKMVVKGEKLCFEVNTTS